MNYVTKYFRRFVICIIFFKEKKIKIANGIRHLKKLLIRKYFTNILGLVTVLLARRVRLVGIRMEKKNQ